ncbi:MAG: uncharacterized protein PWP60_524, partial [Candidatus Atribacteria bacterium]|nr:uncharacterized protein [Candidatus Atribacteria bacterium]
SEEESLSSERQKILDLLPKEILSSYQEIISSSVEPVIVELNQGICEGCNLQVPTIVAKQVRKKEIVRCPNCGRLLLPKP